FAVGESRTTVTVPVRGDNFAEPDETFQFVLTLPSGPVSVTATILNDDTQVAGDFNEDGVFDCGDVDQLVANIAAFTNNPVYDLTGDGSVNSADLAEWLALAGAANLPSHRPYLPGDATLDGAVDGSDFNVWNGRKFTMGTGWCGGDFSADGLTDGSDFNIWNANKFQVSDAARPLASEAPTFATAVDQAFARYASGPAFETRFPIAVALPRRLAIGPHRISLFTTARLTMPDSPEGLRPSEIQDGVRNFAP
ncbi:MAG TPA: hypothetical protein VIY86_00935, partial [Pirellulaceae bacterium]